MKKKQFLTTARILLLGAPLVLAACTNDFGPYPMPSGYAHHDELYKAPPGPEPVWKKINHMKPAQSVKKENCPPEQMKAETVMSAPSGSGWDSAAHDLVSRLVDGFGTPAEPVFLQPADGAAPDAGLENSLRAAMTDKGFNVASSPGMGPFTLRYSAHPLEMGDGSRMMVTVTLTSGAGVVQEVSGIYSPGDAMAVPAPVVEAAPAPMPESHDSAPTGQPMPIGPLN